MRRKTLIGSVLALVLGVSTALAQQSMDGPYVLHEYFEEIEGGSEAGGPQPTAASNRPTGPEVPPSLSLEARPGEPIYSDDGPVFEEAVEEPHGPLTPFGGSNTLDDRTDRVDSLTYFSNFEPSVIPYKRTVAQNRVVRKPGGDYVLELRAGDVREVELSSEPGEDVDTFWGTYLLRLEPGQPQPVASVAPDQRILRIETEPSVAVTLQRDRADNYYVRSRTGGLVRLNVQIAAPTYYFSGDFTPVAWDDFPASQVPPLEPRLRQHALKVAASAGFTRDRPPEDVIIDMVAYFRDFDAKPLPDDLQDKDRLTAIVGSQIGVCRHRSLAFVVVAQALGFPTRYVYNEAHAFVEVFWPAQGWRRIDLGGAADELNASAGEGRTMHDTGPDDLPTPERFLEEQERMARNGWSGPDYEGSGDNSSNGAEGEGDKEGEGENVEGENVEGESTSEGEPSEGQPTSEGEPGEVETLEVPGEETESVPPPTFTEPPDDDRTPTRLSIEEATAVVRRGGDLRLTARLTTSAGQPLAGRRVEVYLGPVGATEPGTAVRLGEIRTGVNGRVRARVKIPRKHSIGRWSLFLHFPGDGDHRPTTAE